MTLTPHAQNSNDLNREDFRFAGFDSPNTTPVPDVFFDLLAPNLTESELRVLIYIMRRTFGFKKQQDNISLKQMVEGIHTREGVILDSGTGMSKPGVTKGVKGLVQKGVVVSTRNNTANGADAPTTYRLHFREDDRGREVTAFTREGKQRLPSRVNAVTPQETVPQETVPQEGFEVSKALPDVDNLVDNSGDIPHPHVVVHYRPITNLITDFSREMGDTEHIASNVTQVHRLFDQSGLSLDDFFTLLYEARLRTRKRSGIENRMAFFFTVLRDLTITNSREESASP